MMAQDGALEGWIRVKLVHDAEGSILLPELVVLDGDGSNWLCPQWVFPPLLMFEEADALAAVRIAALDPLGQDTAGKDCSLSFRRSDRVVGLADGSEIYRCRIETDHDRADLVVGDARVRDDGGVDVRVFHHTTVDTLPLIVESGHVRGSAWNYQGTEQLENVSYAYFTSVPAVRSEVDLQRMAMSSRGEVWLRLDDSQSPDEPDVVLDVYAETEVNRAATLPLFIESELIESRHIWRHRDLSVFYEISHPWIFRVGLESGKNLDFAGEETAASVGDVKQFDYVLIGDAGSSRGLVVPFEERGTGEYFGVEHLAGTNLFDFWYANANQPLRRPPAETVQFVEEDE